MDNRFLFRGKRVDNGEWVEGFYSNHYYEELGESQEIISFQLFDAPSFECPHLQVTHVDAIVDPKTIGMIYDGTTDFNNKKFAVGDKIKMTCLKGHLKGAVTYAIVEYSCGRIHIDLGASLYDVLLKDDYEIEITGTIHDA